ncbi:MAG: DegT/DnrJ/EryC1/StrS family aminotransferase, partial [Candidatus Edwardsbacteria bacterium]|nr:DegT/DnrJ/EryC1/StrS family aminotransferase [Candidatus Edwardsbacteria bacterium]
MIPCSDPQSQYRSHRAEIDAAVGRVLESGHYILGPEVGEFEREFAGFVSAGSAVGVGSGTEALRLALTCCGIGPGDEVVTVSHTAVAAVAAIELAGAVPVLAEIDPRTCTMDPDSLVRLITPRTRAVVPVHLYGQPADMDHIAAIAAAHELAVIEDCAQAHGAALHGRRVGTWGRMGCFSFYPTKNLGAIGDGGAVVTDDPALADRARSLREYGWEQRYISSQPGTNTRLDELQAAILRVKLKYLEADNRARQAIAGLYRERLAYARLELPQVREGCEHVYHLFVVRTAARDALREHLRHRGVQTLVHYPQPVHLQPAYHG